MTGTVLYKNAQGALGFNYHKGHCLLTISFAIYSTNIALFCLKNIFDTTTDNIFFLFFIFLKLSFSSTCVRDIHSFGLLHSSTALLHISCVAPVLIQRLVLNPKSEKITENIARYQRTKHFHLNIPKIVLGIINYKISTCISKCSRVANVLTFQLFEESASRDRSSVNILRTWKPRLFHSSIIIKTHFFSLIKMNCKSLHRFKQFVALCCVNKSQRSSRT